jgi:hypothetical protein
MGAEAGDVEKRWFAKVPKLRKPTVTLPRTDLQCFHDIGCKPSQPFDCVEHCGFSDFKSHLIESLQLAHAAIIYFVEMISIRECAHKRGNGLSEAMLLELLSALQMSIRELEKVCGRNSLDDSYVETHTSFHSTFHEIVVKSSIANKSSPCCRITSFCGCAVHPIVERYGS